jgi:hypothetical protein
MQATILSLIFVVILAVIVYRRGADTTVAAHPRARWLLYAGLLVLGLHTAFYLVFAIGESVGGDLSGLSHLVPAAVLILLMFLAYRRPAESGWVLLAMGLVSMILYSGIGRGGFQFQTFLLAAAPSLLAGLLFLAAAWLAKKAPQ